jgi:hypothetical protein
LDDEDGVISSQARVDDVLPAACISCCQTRRPIREPRHHHRAHCVCTRRGTMAGSLAKVSAPKSICCGCLALFKIVHGRPSCRHDACKGCFVTNAAAAREPMPRLSNKPDTRAQLIL